MSFDFGAFNMFGPLRVVAVRRPSEAFVNDQKISAEWRNLNYHDRPELEVALDEFKVFEGLLRAAGAEIIGLPNDDGLTLDSLYTHDALVVTPKGLVKPRMGKPQRRQEPDSIATALMNLGMPVIGQITGHGKLEGGDLVWLDEHTLIVGIGYRTNAEGVRQLQKLCSADISVIGFDMPHHKGPSDVFHLMSVLSPVDQDLAVVYEPLMPARLVEFLEERGIGFVSVPTDEFESMGCNVLALAPRVAAMVEGNSETERRLRAKGVTVHAFKGTEICRKGEGGPTCMTRPLVRG